MVEENTAAAVVYAAIGILTVLSFIAGAVVMKLIA